MAITGDVVGDPTFAAYQLLVDVEGYENICKGKHHILATLLKNVDVLQFYRARLREVRSCYKITNAAKALQNTAKIHSSDDIFMPRC